MIKEYEILKVEDVFVRFKHNRRVLGHDANVIITNKRIVCKNISVITKAEKGDLVIIIIDDIAKIEKTKFGFTTPSVTIMTNDKKMYELVCNTKKERDDIYELVGKYIL